MLILNRKIDESIIIGNHIEIKILEVVDGKIKIGIEAPKDIRVLRKEVYDAVIAENQASITTTVNLFDLIKSEL